MKFLGDECLSPELTRLVPPEDMASRLMSSGWGAPE
jgi:hypothetical protein